MKSTRVITIRSPAVSCVKSSPPPSLQERHSMRITGGQGDNVTDKNTFIYQSSWKLEDRFWQLPRGHGEWLFPDMMGRMEDILHNFSLRSVIINLLNHVTHYVMMELLPFFPTVHQGVWIPTRASLCNIAPPLPWHWSKSHFIPFSIGCHRLWSLT